LVAHEPHRDIAINEKNFQTLRSFERNCLISFKALILNSQLLYKSGNSVPQWFGDIHD